MISTELIIELAPGAFGGISGAESATKWTGELMYFSMTTLTTVGYGDIVQIHPIARSLSNFEGYARPAFIPRSFWREL